MLKPLNFFLLLLVTLCTACKRKDDSNLAWHYMAKASHNETIGDKKQAIKYCDTLINLDTLKPQSYYYRATIRSNFLDYDGSIRDINKAISLLSKDDYTQLAIYFDFRGDARRLSGQEKEAISDYNTAIQIYSSALDKYAGNDLALEGRSKDEDKIKNYKQAIADLKSAIKHNPQTNFYYGDLAKLENKEGDYKEAISISNQELKLDSNSSIAFYSLGYSYYQLKDFKTAVSNFDRCLKSDPKFYDALYYRGLAKFDLNDQVGACTDWNLAAKNGVNKVASLIKINCK